jgi:hypothetical protein
MVLGLVALVLCWFPFVNWVLAVLAIVFGALGISRANKVGRGKGFAISGLVTGAVGGIIGILIVTVFMSAVKDYASKTVSIEGKINVQTIGKKAKIVYGESSAFPKGSAGPTPAANCCKEIGGMCSASSADWQSPVWQELHFQVTEPSRFHYSYESADGKTFVARAEGDPLCDGHSVSIELHGSVDATGNVKTDLVTP